MVMAWLGIHFVTPPNLFMHLDCWLGSVRRKKLHKGFWIVWHAIIWTMWKARNDIIFNHGTKELQEVVEDI